MSKGNFPLPVSHRLGRRGFSQVGWPQTLLGARLAVCLIPGLRTRNRIWKEVRPKVLSTMHNFPALDHMPRHRWTTCWRVVSQVPAQTASVSLCEQSLQVTHVKQGLRCSLPRSLHVPSWQFPFVILASQFCRLRGWHSDISICEGQGGRGWSSRILVTAT